MCLCTPCISHAVRSETCIHAQTVGTNLVCWVRVSVEQGVVGKVRVCVQDINISLVNVKSPQVRAFVGGVVDKWC